MPVEERQQLAIIYIGTRGGSAVRRASISRSLLVHNVILISTYGGIDTLLSLIVMEIGKALKNDYNILPQPPHPLGVPNRPWGNAHCTDALGSPLHGHGFCHGI